MGRFIPILLLLFLANAPAWATHIVGGEITYRCLGSNNYEIAVTVYRDCDTGVPWFDNPASVGVFGANNQLIMDLRLNLRNNDTLDLFLTDSCFVAPPNVCIHKTTYLDTVNLPFRQGGYQLVYQRCCRNQDIVNIVNPLGTGATYAVQIPETALNSCNSSPVYRDYPPVYLCQNVPIVFDHSAFDLDGDSVVYELYTPFDGATPLNPMPQPPFNPPYTPITWLNPYSLGNVLGGTDVLRIDRQTGLLQGTPTNLGVFVVGIRALEYRNGQLIGTIQRDFQYAVGVCGRRDNAAFFAPVVECNNDLLVSFQNTSQSYSADYRWDFGDLNTVADTSRLQNPVYIYPDTGTYRVRLVVAPASTCSDTFYRDVSVQYRSLNPRFSANINGCTDVATVNISNATTDSISTINYFFWDFGIANIQHDTARGFSPTYTYNTSGTYVITMYAVANNGCRDSIRDTVSFNLPRISLPDTARVCPPNTGIFLNNGGNPTFSYNWSPAAFLDNPNAANPYASPPPPNPFRYEVTVTAPSAVGSGLTCSVAAATVVAFPDSFDIDIIADTATCAGSVLLTAISDVNLALVEWSPRPNFDTVVSTQNPYIYSLPALNSWVYVRGTDANGCTRIDSIQITSGNFGINTNFTYVRGACSNPYPIQFINLTTDTSRGAIASYSWEIRTGNSTLPIFSSNAQNPAFNFQTSGVYTVTLQATSVRACVGYAQAVISVLVPALTTGDTAGICAGSSFVTLNPNGDSRFSYNWSPSTNLSSITAVSPSTNTPVSRTYYVTITGIVGTDTCRVLDSVRVIRPSPLLVNVDSVTVYCSNTVTLAATTNRPVLSYEWAGDPSFFTVISRANPVTITPTTFPLAGYYVRVRDNYGCTATDFALVQQRTSPVNVNFSYGILYCGDSLTAQFNDLTVDTGTARIVSREWTVSNGQTSTQTNPIFSFRQSGNYQVTLTVRLANGCVGTLTRNLSFEISQLNSNSVVYICGNDNSTVLNPNGDPNLDYIWSPANGLSATNVASPTATPPSFPFTYTVTVTGNNGLDACVSVYSIVVERANSVFVNLMPDTVTCRNNITVGGTFDPNAAAIDWSFSPNFNPIAISNVFPVNLGFGNSTDTVVLYIRVRDIFGCFATDSVRVERRILPVPVSFTVNTDCSNQLTADFVVNSSNTRPIMDYFWTFGNGQTANYLNPRAVYTQSGTYPIVLNVSDIWGCTGVFRDTLSFNLAEINSPDSIAQCSTGNIVLNSGGNPNLSYQWSPANLLNNPTAASPTANVQANTNFTVTVTAQNADFVCQDVRNIAVGVGGVALSVSNDTAICGSVITLRAVSNNASAILWALDRNFNLPLGFGADYTTNVNSSRYFYVLATDDFGCFATDSVRVDVNRNPLRASFAVSSLACGDSLRLQFTNTTDTSLHSLIAWGWNFGDGGVSNLENPQHSYNNDGNYTVLFSITASNGCVVNSSQPISLDIVNVANRNDTLRVCAGDSVMLNANGDPTARYIWAAADLSNRFIYNPIASPSQNTNYFAQVISYQNLNGRLDSCVENILVRVELEPRPSISLPDSLFVCQDSFSLSASSNGLDLEWSDRADFSNIISNGAVLSSVLATNAAFYHFRADNNGCAATDSVWVEIKPASVQLNDTAFVCQLPNTVQLNAENLAPDQQLVYSWSPANAVLNGQGTAQINADLQQSQRFTVQVQNQYGCRDTASANVSLQGNGLSVDIFVSRDTVNQGDTLQLVASFNPDYSYTWANNPDLSNLNVYNPTARVTNTGFYQLTVTDLDGCIAVDSILISVRPNNCGEPYIFVPNAFTPDGDGLNDVVFVRGANLNGLYFAVYNRWGELVFQTSDQSQGWDGTMNGQQLSPDVYGFYLQCTCGDGQRYFKKGNITLIR